MIPPAPSYDGRGLVNLVAELERRLTGNSASPGLAPGLSSSIPERRSYILVLFDGLGEAQLGARLTPALSRSMAGVLDAPFATTTTVSLATLATGLPPRSHGVLGHLLWLPEVRKVTNSLKWVDLAGRRVEYDTSALLPSPNLWERLRDEGVEPITVQPAGFATTPLTAALYRGCRFEGVETVAEAIEAASVLAREPNRLVLAYLPHVDFAAHVYGQASQSYREALGLVDGAWVELRRRVGEHAAVVGTADHGHIDYDEEAKQIVRDPAFEDLVFYGDPRAVMVKGAREEIIAFADATGGSLGWMPEVCGLWGDSPPHASFPERAPDAVVLAPPGKVIIPPGFDKRLVGYHGGLEPAEVRVPLLVG